MDASSLSKKERKINEDYKFVTPTVSSVEIIEPCTLLLTFSNNERKLINFTNYLTKTKIFIPYLQPKLFATVQLNHGCLKWKGNTLDFHYSSLYNWK